MKTDVSRMRGRGFTLIEILIVILIIGVIMAIVLPNFVKMRDRSWQRSCTKNLREIHVAKERYLMDERLPRNTPSSVFTDAVLFGPTQYLHDKPRCSAGGSYSIGDGETFPTCDYQGGGVHVYNGE